MCNDLKREIIRPLLGHRENAVIHLIEIKSVAILKIVCVIFVSMRKWFVYQKAMIYLSLLFVSKGFYWILDRIR